MEGFKAGHTVEEIITNPWYAYYMYIYVYVYVYVYV